MKYELIKSTDKDCTKLIEYKKETILEYADSLPDDEIEKINNYVINEVPKQLGNYFNIVIGGKIVGCILLTDKDDGKLLD